MLRVFGAHVDQAFGHVPYHVGSSLVLDGGKGRRWRDVDVRLILPDDEFEGYFGPAFSGPWDAPKLMMWNLAWTALGKQLTGLPIDFQIQPELEAAYEKGPRSALVITADDLRVIGTRSADLPTPPLTVPATQPRTSGGDDA